MTIKPKKKTSTSDFDISKVHYDDPVEGFNPDLLDTVRIPYYATRVPAGFPDPEDEPKMEKLELNAKYVRNPETSFCVRVSGDSMQGAGIDNRSLLVVDTAIPPQNGAIVLARLNGEITLKRFFQKDGKTKLVDENPYYPPIDIKPTDDFNIIGVIMKIIHSV